MIIFEFRFRYQRHYLIKGRMRLTGKLGLIAMVITLLCCSCEKERKPQDVMNEDQMIDFLIEVYLAEARLSTKIFNRDSAQLIFDPYEKLLLQRKGINDSILKKSYDYYIAHPDEMRDVMDAVIDSLSLREQAGTIKTI